MGEALFLEPTEEFGAAKASDAAEELPLSTLRLKDNPAVAAEHASRAKAMENRVESVYREAVADLFSGPEDVHQVMAMLKLRELYRHLSCRPTSLSWAPPSGARCLLG